MILFLTPFFLISIKKNLTFFLSPHFRCTSCLLSYSWRWHLFQISRHCVFQCVNANIEFTLLILSFLHFIEYINILCVNTSLQTRWAFPSVCMVDSKWWIFICLDNLVDFSLVHWDYSVLKDEGHDILRRSFLWLIHFLLLHFLRSLSVDWGVPWDPFRDLALLTPKVESAAQNF